MGEALAPGQMTAAATPSVSADLTALCWTLIRAGRSVEAGTHCEQALALDAKDWTARLRLGHTFLLAGDNVTAQQHYRDTLWRIATEQDLRTVALADFNIFTSRGWQAEASRAAQMWFQSQWPRWQTVLALTREDIRLSNAGRLQQSLVPSTEALRLSEEILGPDHPETGTQLDNLSQTYMALGDDNRALPLALRSLAIADKTWGAEYPGSDGLLNNLAVLYRQTDQPALALPLLQRRLVIAERQRGLEHATTGLRLSSLAALYEALGQPDKALPLSQRALAIAERSPPPENKLTGTRLNSLGVLLNALGQHEAALPLLQRALAIAQTNTDSPTRDIATRLNNLAVVLRALARYDEALPLLKSTLAMAEQAQRPNDAVVRASLGNLAGLFEDIGQYENALPLYARALSMAERSKGPNHPDTGVHLNNMAGLYETLGQYDLALPMFQRALAIAEHARGPEHPNTGTSVNNLAVLFHAKGQFETALPLFRRALAIAEQGGAGANHPITGARQNNLAWLLQAMGRYDEALPLLQRALAIAEQSQGPEHPSTCIRINNLAGLLDSMGQHDQALALYQRGLVIAEQTGRPELAWTLQDNLMRFHARRRSAAQAQSPPGLAIWYGKQAVNTLQAARGRLRQLQEGLQQSFVGKNESTYQTLANLLIEAGRITEAEQVLSMLKERELANLLRSPEAPRTQADYAGVELPAIEAQRRLASSAAASVADRLRFITGLQAMFAQSGPRGGDSQAAAQRTRLQGKVLLDSSVAVGLHYVVTDERVGIIVATPNGSFGRFSGVTRSQLNRHIEALRRAVVGQHDTRASAQALWQALIAPVQADLLAAGAKTLVLSLTDALRYLPFAALKTRPGVT